MLLNPAATMSECEIEKINLTVDTRGNLLKAFKHYFKVHYRKAKRFNLIDMPNAAIDLESDNPNLGIKNAFEWKIGRDCHSSLVSKLLQKELEETYIPADVDERWVITCNTPSYKITPQDYLWLISAINDYHPTIRLKSYGMGMDAISGVLDMIENPPNLSNVLKAPVHYRKEDKGILLSVSSLMDGIVPGAVKYMFEQEAYPIHGWDDLIKMDPTKLRYALEEVFYRYYDNTEKQVLAAKFVKALHQKYSQKERRSDLFDF